MAGWPDPKVVVSDRPPAQVAVRSGEEEAAVNELLAKMRAGRRPIVLVFRTPDGEIEAAARSAELGGSVQTAVDIMQQASAKLVASLFRGGCLPARPS